MRWAPIANLDRFLVKATAKKVSRRNMMLKVTSLIMTASLSLLLIFYGLANFASTLGNFTIKVNPIEQEGTKRVGISLSNDLAFTNPTTNITVDAIEKMDNITESWLPTDIDQVDGPHNGENYIAHTFYLKNVGDLTIDYSAEIKILEVGKEADEAIRVKVYKNGEETVYAKKQKGLQIPEPNTTPFHSIDKVMSQTNEAFEIGSVDKYTIVVWLEGNDPECIDNIIGGRVRLEMNFVVVDAY